MMVPDKPKKMQTTHRGSTKGPGLWTRQFLNKSLQHWPKPARSSCSLEPAYRQKAGSPPFATPKRASGPTTTQWKWPRSMRSTRIRKPSPVGITGDSLAVPIVSPTPATRHWPRSNEKSTTEEEPSHSSPRTSTAFIRPAEAATSWSYTARSSHGDACRPESRFRFRTSRSMSSHHDPNLAACCDPMSSGLARLFQQKRSKQHWMSVATVICSSPSEQARPSTPQQASSISHTPTTHVRSRSIATRLRYPEPWIGQCRANPERSSRGLLNSPLVSQSEAKRSGRGCPSCDSPQKLTEIPILAAIAAFAARARSATSASGA